METESQATFVILKWIRAVKDRLQLPSCRNEKSARTENFARKYAPSRHRVIPIFDGKSWEIRFSREIRNVYKKKKKKTTGERVHWQLRDRVRRRASGNTQSPNIVYRRTHVKQALARTVATRCCALEPYRLWTPDRSQIMKKRRLTGHDEEQKRERKEEKGWTRAREGRGLRARLRVRSAVQKRGTQERPWIYVDVSPEVNEKEKGLRRGGRGWRREMKQGQRGRNICRLRRRVNATRLFLAACHGTKIKTRHITPIYQHACARRDARVILWTVSILSIPLDDIKVTLLESLSLLSIGDTLIATASIIKIKYWYLKSEYIGYRAFT